MPLYTYQCPTCSGKRQIFRKIAARDERLDCGKCGFQMNRTIEAPFVRGDYQGYTCPITEKWIEGRRAHEENLKTHGCRVLEPGEKEGNERRRAADEAAFEERVGETAAALVANLPSDKKEKLAAELDAGINATVTRT